MSGAKWMRDCDAFDQTRAEDGHNGCVRRLLLIAIGLSALLWTVAARSGPIPAHDLVKMSGVESRTLSRTIITAGTTFLSVVALYLFGGESLQGFAFTMLVGIVAGTYSTVFIASSLAILLSRFRKKTRREVGILRSEPNASGGLHV